MFSAPEGCHENSVWCTIKTFTGGLGLWIGWGVIKESFQKHLEIGRDKGKKSFVGGRGTKGVTTNESIKILIVHMRTLGSAMIYVGDF